MNERAKSNWLVAATRAAVTLVPAGMVTAVLVGARGPDPADIPAASLSSAQPAADTPTEQLSVPIDVQSPLDMTEQHHAMMDQMRASVSASMNELMKP